MGVSTVLSLSARENSALLLDTVSFHIKHSTYTIAFNSIYIFNLFSMVSLLTHVVVNCFSVWSTFPLFCRPIQGKRNNMSNMLNRTRWKYMLTYNKEVLHKTIPSVTPKQKELHQKTIEAIKQSDTISQI